MSVSPAPENPESRGGITAASDVALRGRREIEAFHQSSCKYIVSVGSNVTVAQPVRSEVIAMRSHDSPPIDGNLRIRDCRIGNRPLIAPSFVKITCLYREIR